MNKHLLIYKPYKFTPLGWTTLSVGFRTSKLVLPLLWLTKCMLAVSDDPDDDIIGVTFDAKDRAIPVGLWELQSIATNASQLRQSYPGLSITGLYMASILCSGR